jgi:archaeosine synthase beta-subunit
MISLLHEKPLASWRGKERLGDTLVECLTIIFRSAGCSWSRCRMCSYRHERYEVRQSPEDLADHLRAQLAWVSDQYRSDEYQMVKIFTSGSFFDPEEVPPEFVKDVALAFSGKVLIVETRPEFVDEDVCRNLIETIDNGQWKIPLYCATGLETSSDSIREKSINKGFVFKDFENAAARAHAAGAGVKAYLLFKPLFLTEGEAIADMVSSIRDASKHADLISMNPCTVQRKTELEYYWKRGAYRPPYLWSILILLEGAPVHVSCDPLGGGQKRGPHDCGKCDYEIVKGIRDYSLSADRDLISALLETQCDCRDEWEFVLANEKPYAMPLTR